MKMFNYKIVIFIHLTNNFSFKRKSDKRLKDSRCRNLENNWEKFSFGNSKAAGGQTSRSASKLMSVSLSGI